jgi:hypothetical protein
LSARASIVKRQPRRISPASDVCAEVNKGKRRPTWEGQPGRSPTAQVTADEVTTRQEGSLWAIEAADVLPALQHLTNYLDLTDRASG